MSIINIKENIGIPKYKQIVNSIENGIINQQLKKQKVNQVVLVFIPLNYIMHQASTWVLILTNIQPAMR